MLSSRILLTALLIGSLTGRTLAQPLKTSADQQAFQQGTFAGATADKKHYHDD